MKPDRLRAPSQARRQNPRQRVSAAPVRPPNISLTRWSSMDAIRDFPGSEIDKAVVEPAAVAALVDFDAKVHHYEVVEEA